jgi:hypothetical protein
MVLDFSKDRNNPNSLSKTRLDLARKFLANSEDNSEDSEGDERINSNSLSNTRLDLARKFLANSKDSEGDERIPLAFRNIVLFDMTLEDLESNVVNGCLLCCCKDTPSLPGRIRSSFSQQTPWAIIYISVRSS